ncbi:ABC transporter permease [Desulfovibrio sp. PG-178-WT-4]|uniref:ABC transporter permease n=1 Tax=Desulfovibrio porci TaxID=2605782 RepID=A0A6L5XMJ6_9BACT|nr:ABC transporter permease [Desulfovibrio porci]MDY3809930.1 ABC transporter permease [Desulfovibrio porci]MSS28402.1 ABC transporter permease [Desulfovibrio porci]
MASSSIANETVDHAAERGRFTLYKLITNTYFLYAVSIVAFFSLWHWTAAEKIFRDSLATPAQVLDQMIRLTSMKFAGTNLWGHIWASFQRVIIGFALASVVAVPLGLFMALNKTVNAVVKPLFDLFKPMPPIAWVSIAILWFGIGEFSKVFIIIIGTFVPCLLNAYNGVRLVDPDLYDVIRVLGGNRRDEIFHVCFPASFPAVFAGLQISLSAAWTCVLAAELMNSRDGLGFLIKRGMDTHNPSLVLSGMLLIAAAAWVSSLGVSLLERKLCPWKRSIDNV